MRFDRPAALICAFGAMLSVAPAFADDGGVDTKAGISTLPLSVMGSQVVSINSSGMTVGTSAANGTLTVLGDSTESGNVSVGSNLIVGGNVGVGSNSPQAALDVNGGVRIGGSGGACNAATAGTVRYNGGVFEGCNGSSWGAVSRPPPNKSANLSFTIPNICAGSGTVSLDCSATTDADGNIWMPIVTSGGSGMATTIATVQTHATFGGGLQPNCPDSWQVYQFTLCSADAAGLTLAWFNQSGHGSVVGVQQAPTAFAPWQ